MEITLNAGPYDDVGHRQAWRACSQLSIDGEEAWQNAIPHGLLMVSPRR
jgi:hypothetical protein